MLNNAGNSRMDTLLKIVLIFVLSVLSFSIGAFVGKQVSDTEHRQALLENEFGTDRSVASVDPSATQHKPKNALSDEDISSLTEEFVNAEKTSLAENKKMKVEASNDHEETHASDHSGYKKYGKKSALSDEEELTLEPQYDTTRAKADSPEPKPAHKVESVSPAAQRVAQGMAPTKDAPKVRVPNSVLPSNPTSSVGKYTIQLASYATETEAKSHAEALKAKGYGAFYVPANVNGKDWYRVSIGLFPDHKSAMAYREEIKSEAGVKSSIVQKIVQ